MRMSRVAIAWLLFTGSSCALAHAHLADSTPADGAHLTAPPRTLVLHFSEKAQLTALWVERSGAAPQKLTPLPEQPADRISIALPALEPGAYLIRWRVLGGDGHIAPGQIRFVIDR
jgi:methionine-rich copper-binding protein CopC